MDDELVTELKKRVAVIRTSEIFNDPSKSLKDKFNIISIEAFKPYADWFLSTFNEKFINPDKKIYIDYLKTITPILREDMLSNNPDNPRTYTSYTNSFYFYLLAYFFLNLTAYRKDYEMLSNMFFTFEEQSLTGEWEIFKAHNINNVVVKKFNSVLETYKDSLPDYLPENTKLCNTLIIVCIKNPPKIASKKPPSTLTSKDTETKLKGPSGSRKKKDGKKFRQNKSKKTGTKKTHKKRQNKHKKHHNKSKKLI